VFPRLWLTETVSGRAAAAAAVTPDGWDEVSQHRSMAIIIGHGGWFTAMEWACLQYAGSAMLTRQKKKKNTTLKTSKGEKKERRKKRRKKKRQVNMCSRPATSVAPK
jgi:hypothetical protein